MRILAIETSCDETAAAVVEDGRKILSNIVATSAEIHKKTGGIIPEVAAREQVRCIIPVIGEALLELAEDRGWKMEVRNKNLASTLSLLSAEIDALAVTIGPGLNGSLLVGVETAKTIAYVTGKPIIPVNHIFAHIYANFLSEPREHPRGVRPDSSDGEGIGERSRGIRFPTIALVVSGGHTELFLMENHKKIKWLGGTRDDAAGEAFDKTARLLGLGFPGGPAIAAAADKPTTHNPQLTTKLPRPMIDSDDLNFSFSGLKTAVIREINKLNTMKQSNNETISQLAYEIQESITDVLVKKTLKAARQFNVKSILLGGGVAANQRLKEKFNSQLITHNSQLFIPPPSFCTDNAAYIGSFAYFHNQPVAWKDVDAQPDLTVEV